MWSAVLKMNWKDDLALNGQFKQLPHIFTWKNSGYPWPRWTHLNFSGEYMRQLLKLSIKCKDHLFSSSSKPHFTNNFLHSFIPFTGKHEPNKLTSSQQWRHGTAGKSIAPAWQKKPRGRFAPAQSRFAPTLESFRLK